MKINRILSAISLLAAGVVFVQAQMLPATEVPQEAGQPVKNGPIQPYFWIGGYVTQSLGYNFQTGAMGIKNTDPGDGSQTWVSISAAMVDSHYTDPKMYEVGDDPDIWTGHFIMVNPTLRVVSYKAAPEMNTTSWLAEITGHGFHLGLFTQNGQYVEGADLYTNNPGYTFSDSSLVAGNEVLYITPSSTAATPGYIDNDVKANLSPITTYFTLPTSNPGGIMSIGYKVPDLYSVNLGVESQGNVDTPASDLIKYGGFSGSLDFSLSPWGPEASEDKPMIAKFEANGVAGTQYTTAPYNPVGFGAKASGQIWLGDYMILTPVAAFDGKLNDTWTIGAPIPAEPFQWEAGGGFIFSFSPKKWVYDDYSELQGKFSASSIYGKEKIQKYSYAQVYAAYSPDYNLQMVFKAEEPDGAVGFDENLGAMVEVLLNNLTANSHSSLLAPNWSVLGRVEYDLADHTIVPYIRSYYDSFGVLKLRTGVQMGVLPHTGFELTYTSQNLNSAATHLNAFDAGRLEFIVTITTNDGIVMTPKTRHAKSGDESSTTMF